MAMAIATQSASRRVAQAICTSLVFHRVSTLTIYRSERDEYWEAFDRWFSEWRGNRNGDYDIHEGEDHDTFLITLSNGEWAALQLNYVGDK
jgi:hypothetical protein